MWSVNRLSITLFIFVLYTNLKVSAQQNNKDSLIMYRMQIDSLDEKIISLIGMRMSAVEKVGIYKARHHIPVLQQKRFDAIVNKNIILGEAVHLSANFIRAFMDAIHKESLKKEESLQHD